MRVAVRVRVWVWVTARDRVRVRVKARVKVGSKVANHSFDTPSLSPFTLVW